MERDSVAQNTNRIAKNTILLYIRLLFGMIVALYTGRVIVSALGIVDVGVYDVVGGFVGFFSIVSSSLSASVSRFLTYELGKGDKDNLKSVFATSLIIHIGLAIIVFILCETIGLYAVNHIMEIPPDRLVAANWIFQFSIITFVLGLIQVPYTAVIVAHEKMNMFAYLGVLAIVLKLVIVIFIAYSNLTMDKLIIYALLLALVGLILQIITYSYCKKNFEETHFKLRFNRGYVKEIGSFAGWNFIGCTASILKDYGVNFLINIFYGPILNGARYIANMVNGAITSFSSSFMTAVNPQITKSLAANEKEYMFSLVERGSKFGFFIMMILSLPILLEADFIIDLWQENPVPAHTINFTRLVLILSLIDVLSHTLITTQLATGKIKRYQIFVGGTLLMNFPLSYICLYLNFSPESVYFVAIFIAVACLFLRLHFLRGMIDFPVKSFIKNVCLKVCEVFCLSIIIPLFLYLTLDYGWYRVIIVSGVAIICSILSAFYVGCTRNERNFIIQKIINLKDRFIK